MRAAAPLAAGLRWVALAAAVAGAGRALAAAWPAAAAPEAACAAYVEVVVGGGRPRLRCAPRPGGAAADAAADVVAGDRLRCAGGRCRREAGAMAAASRLLVGLPLYLNEASAAELARVPGLSPRQAAAIVAHRAAVGRLDDVGALARVHGIGPATLRQVRPYLTVAPR